MINVTLTPNPLRVTPNQLFPPPVLPVWDLLCIPRIFKFHENVLWVGPLPLFEKFIVLDTS